MLETSQDLFYLVLAFCVLWFTVFVCWMLYYFIRMLKQTNQLLTDIREKIERVTSVFSFIRSKIVEQGVKGLMSFVSAVTGKSARKNKNKK